VEILPQVVVVITAQILAENLRVMAFVLTVMERVTDLRLINMRQVHLLLRITIVEAVNVIYVANIPTTITIDARLAREGRNRLNNIDCYKS
jgi:hypothetical protein